MERLGDPLHAVKEAALDTTQEKICSPYGIDKPLSALSQSQRCAPETLDTPAQERLLTMTHTHPLTTPGVTCYDCGVEEGQFHADLCQVPSCPHCGHQRLSCGCPSRLRKRVRFLEWPQICSRCGILWPDFFRVPDKEWQRTVPMGHRQDILCKPCFLALRTILGLPPCPNLVDITFEEDDEPFEAPPANDPEPFEACPACVEEHRAHMDAALALGDVLLDALDTYTDVHTTTTYAQILEA